MELVPIVITSLEIVLALAVITFIISYISYKIKSKNSPEEYEPGKDMKPRFATRRFNRLTYITKEIMHVSNPKEIPPKPRSENPLPKPAAEKKHAVKKEIVASAKQARPKIEPKQKRLEVMKNLVPDPRPHDEISNKNSGKVKQDMNSLDDDILNKYVDDENHPLFSLKTNKDDKNK